MSEKSDDHVIAAHKAIYDVLEAELGATIVAIDHPAVRGDRKQIPGHLLETARSAAHMLAFELASQFATGRQPAGAAERALANLFNVLERIHP